MAAIEAGSPNADERTNVCVYVSYKPGQKGMITPKGGLINASTALGTFSAMVALQPLSPMPSLMPQRSRLRTPAAEPLHRRHSRVIARLCSCSQRLSLTCVRADVADFI